MMVRFCMAAQVYFVLYGQIITIAIFYNILFLYYLFYKIYYYYISSKT